MKTTSDQSAFASAPARPRETPSPTGEVLPLAPRTYPNAGLSYASNLGWIAVAAGAFHLAYLTPSTSFLVVLYLFALFQLARNTSARMAFCSGLTVGLLVALGRLTFFWNIFGAGCAALWLVYAFWTGLFTALTRLCLRRAGPGWACLLGPCLWCGLEYFRSELYYLRFSWLSPGYAFGSGPEAVPLQMTGAYGIGFLMATIAGVCAFFWNVSRIRGMAALGAGTALMLLGSLVERPTFGTASASTVRVAGVQMEFPSEPEVLVRLNELIRKYPQAELLVLSEYTFNDPVPEKIRNWCRQNRRYLLVGGKDPAPGGNYYDTGFVVSPAGEIVFRQGKMVPIQFFKDGLPAPQQQLWDSPWGKIGICICYDLSYRRVTDRLVELGARALLVPTMDVIDWGRSQHELHARVAPIRSAEYGIPIFRVASSGISQLVDARGRTVARAPFPGDGAMLAGVLELGKPGHLPLDHWFAPAASMLTGLLAILLFSGWPRAQRIEVRSPGGLPS